MAGELFDSRDTCLKVLELKPQHFGALSGLVQVHLGLGEVREAAEVAQKLNEVHPASGRGVAPLLADALRKVQARQEQQQQQSTRRQSDEEEEELID